MQIIGVYPPTTKAFFSSSAFCFCSLWAQIKKSTQPFIHSLQEALAPSLCKPNIWGWDQLIKAGGRGGGVLVPRWSSVSCRVGGRGQWKGFQTSECPVGSRPSSHLHLWTTGQAESIGLLCGQTILQCPSHCTHRKKYMARKWSVISESFCVTLSAAWLYTITVLTHMIFGWLANASSLGVASAGWAPEWLTWRSSPWSHQLCRLCSSPGLHCQSTMGEYALKSKIRMDKELELWAQRCFELTWLHKPKCRTHE